MPTNAPDLLQRLIAARTTVEQAAIVGRRLEKAVRSLYVNGAPVKLQIPWS